MALATSSNMSNCVPAPCFLRTDLDSSEALAPVRVEDSQGNVIVTCIVEQIDTVWATGTSIVILEQIQAVR